MCLAIPAKVVELLADDQAVVEMEGVRKQISLALLDEIVVGDYVIVHVGYALQKIDPAEAQSRAEEAAQRLAAAITCACGNAVQTRTTQEAATNRAAASAEPPPTPEAIGRRLASVIRAPAPTSHNAFSLRAARITRLRSTGSAESGPAKGPMISSDKSAAGAASTTSPASAKTKRLSSACSPSRRAGPT